MNELDKALLEAHASEDGCALVSLYTEAADAAGDPTACSFYLTHAYVFALENNHPAAPKLRARLVEMGCEDPD